MTGGPAAAERPRTLLLAVDGVPYRAMAEALSCGAFAGWPAPGRLIAPFPSMTGVSFAELFRPFGSAAADGYEIRHFDLARNAVVGNPLRPRRHGRTWKACCNIAFETLPAKVAMYGTPRWTGRLEVAAVRAGVLGSTTDPIVAYVGSTDGLAHIRGDGDTVRFLLDLDAEIASLKRRHLQAHGRPLRVLMFSDHGMGRTRVRAVNGLSGALRRAGLRVAARLSGPADVVAPTFGVVGYGSLFTAPALAETAALAVAQHEAVELAAWSTTAGAIEVVSRRGRARVRWRAVESRPLFACEPIAGDPLRLDDARRRLEATGRLRADGFADDRDWLEATADSYYPDPLRRLAEALGREGVRNRASVLFSLAPGRAWGWRLAHAAARVTGGRLQGTHGGLDRDSSLGFVLSDDPALSPRPAVRASEALSAFARG